jgi:zinc/manganese transport system ATP-binding protein
MATSSTCLSLRDVRVSYDDQIALHIRQLDFELGTSVAVMGAHGSGKTTLLNAIAGIAALDKGSVDSDIEHFAHVPQHHHRSHGMPDEVPQALKLGRLGARLRSRRADRSGNSAAPVPEPGALASALERLEVSDLADRPLDEMSGGQRQRVLMARALAQGAQGLLLDEPNIGLDARSRGIILDIVVAERDAGRLVILTTHHPEQAQVCDRLVVLDAGNVVG